MKLRRFDGIEIEVIKTEAARGPGWADRVYRRLDGKRTLNSIRNYASQHNILAPRSPRIGSNGGAAPAERRPSSDHAPVLEKRAVRPSRGGVNIPDFLRDDFARWEKR